MSSALVKVPQTTEEEKYYQFQQQQELELIKLSRQYDVLDREHTRHLATGFPKLNKSLKVVNIFKSEYENILNDLAVASSPEKTRLDNVQFEHLQQQLQKYDRKTEQLKIRKTYLQEVEGQIRQTSKSVQALKKQQKSDRHQEERVHAARQTLETLENKLETQMKTFNVMVTKNLVLRNEIDYLMWDRSNFMIAWQKLIDKLNTGKHIMLDLIEQASIAYDQREDWCNKLQMLRVTGHKDFLLHTDQMRAFNQHADDALKLADFFSIKGQKRVTRDLYRKETIKRMEQQTKLEERLESYQLMMSDIEKFTRLKDTAVIANNYYNSEAQNFTQFQYIIDALGEMERVSDYMIALHFDIEEQRRLTEERTIQQRMDLDSFADDLSVQQKITLTSEEELAEIDDHLGEMMSGILKLFRMCKCDQDPLLKLLGDNSTITNYNVLLYVEILEKTIHECLVKAAYKTQQTRERRTPVRIFSQVKDLFKVYGIEKIIDAHPCSLCVEHEMVSDVIDVVQHPWSKDEVRRKLGERLKLPGGTTTIHTISKCHLPRARRVIQQRYM